MSKEVRNLEPRALWNKFSDLNAVPRASKKEEEVKAFMQEFGASLGLETKKDAIGNIFIFKPATAGMEDRKKVCMQSHLDMVHQKNADTDFDFATQGIQMHIDGDWVKAKGTTLGADNGIGVATIMAILASKDIAHPAIEALFTIDEETGMTGALGLEAGWLSSDILLNLDTEEDDEIGVGCAGGIDVTATRTYDIIDTPANTTAYDITIKGLNGGHSGMDIHKGLGNANKILFRLLYATQHYGLHIATMNGGSLRNAIPREAFATVVIDEAQKADFEATFKTLTTDILAEYKVVESDLSITFEATDTPAKVMCGTAQKAVINAVCSAHNGVYRMSPSIEGLVETSNNVAKVTIENGDVAVLNLTRSSVESTKHALVRHLTASFELAGFQVETDGDYPGWAPDMDSSILKVLEATYERLNGEKPHVAACHAGLECGILGRNYPNMEMISFGPTIRGAHSPDERCSISSVQKYWTFVLDILKNTPKK